MIVHRGKLLLAGGLVVVVAAAAVVTALVLSADHSKAGEAVAADPIALHIDDVPSGTSIGVVLTLGSAPLHGAEWKDSAQGAAVAARRLSLGNTPVTLTTVNDEGTEAGAIAAVAHLSQAGVSGIIFATDGDHLGGALAQARKAGISVLLPYAQVPAHSGAGVWSTAPSTDQISGALTRALAGTHHPLVIDAGGGVPAGVASAETLRFASGGDAGALGTEVAHRTGVPSAEDPDHSEAPAHPADAVLISGAPAVQAQLVRALQAAKVEVPLVLTPAATSPAFLTALRAAEGNLSAHVVTVGSDIGDSVALRNDPEGRAMSAFLGGLRQLAADPDAQNLSGDQPFSAVAGSADTRSHDAVISLVRAVAAAHSTEPTKVTSALRELKLGSADAIAGSALDFSTPEALRGTVLPLYGSVQNLGLRPLPTSGDSSAQWFAAPPAA